MVIQEASFTGLLRTVFIIIGVIVLLRFLGRYFTAKREREALRNLESREEEIRQAKENSGKLNILDQNAKSTSNKTEDVDFEELKD